MARGEARPGPGRPPGSPNKMQALVSLMRTIHKAEPLDFFLTVMKREKEDVRVRLEAAKAAALYMMSKLETVEHVLEENGNEMVDLSKLSDEELVLFKNLQAKAKFKPNRDGNGNHYDYRAVNFFGHVRSRDVPKKGGSRQKLGGGRKAKPQRIRKRSVVRGRAK
jgi:hypothetical protein